MSNSSYQSEMLRARRNTKRENMKVSPVMHTIKDPTYEKHNRPEQIELRYGKSLRPTKRQHLSFRLLEQTHYRLSSDAGSFTARFFFAERLFNRAFS